MRSKWVKMVLPAAVLALLVVGAAACDVADSDAPNRLVGPPSNALAQLASPLLVCDALAYAADVEVVGPAGGELQIGPHTLSIPKGALAEPVEIKGEVDGSGLVAVQLSPHGLKFAKSPTLRLSYGHCAAPVSTGKSLVYVDDALNILEFPTSHDAKSSEEVVGLINHFSRYAVATN